jgi:hypothetical protein
MRTILYVLTTLSVVALAFWAYRENYATQASLSETRELRRDILAAHERLSVLRAEWAYLNRPDRLRDLADLNFDTLGLLPLRADQFGNVDQVAYPQPEFLPITDPIEVSDTQEVSE